MTAGVSGLAGTPRQIGSALDPSSMPIASPWSTGELAQILAADVFPNGVPTNTRTAAMRIPAIKRGRNLLVNAVRRSPLRVADVNGVLPPAEQPTWLYRTNRSSPDHRIVWTVDDLMFYGVSAWWVERGARTDGSWPLHVDRLNMGTWTINADNRAVVNGTVVSDEQIIIIPAFDEGVLALGSDALHDIRALYEIVRDRLRNPVTVTELHQVDGPEMTETEIDAMLDKWRVARRKPGGTVGYTNKHIEAKFHGDQADAQFLVDARNAAAVDAGRLIGVSAGMLDATAPKASLNYETQTGRNQEFVDLDVDYYMGPIEARLSMDDCVPAGKRTVFDRADLTAPAPSPTGPERQD